MLMNATSPLDLTKASFGYAGKRVVDAITVSIESGDVVALLGPNGSGKSTLVKGILGLADLQAGTLTRNATIGYVPQRHSLSNAVRATVTEIVATGRLTRRPWWKSASTADEQAVAEPCARRSQRPLGWAAAPSPDRPRPGQRPASVGHGRADGRCR